MIAFVFGAGKAIEGLQLNGFFACLFYFVCLFGSGNNKNIESSADDGGLIEKWRFIEKQEQRVIAVIFCVNNLCCVRGGPAYLSQPPD